MNFILARVERLSRPAAPLLAGIWFLATLPALIIWHPYQQAFLNVLAGDPRTVHERFETDYWMTSYKEAATYLNSLQIETGRPLAVFIGANGLSAICFGHFALPTMRIGFGIGPSGNQPFPKEADYSVTIPRYGMWKNFPEAPVIHEIRRNGALLCIIRKRPELAPGDKAALEKINAR
jgi:hypothetical protein